MLAGSDCEVGQVYMRRTRLLSKESSVQFVVLLAVCAAAFLTRLMPLHTSQYPFNNDAVTECGMASEIIRSDSFIFGPDSIWYGTHGASTPAFNILIAFVSSCLGIPPLLCAQMIVASLSVLTAATFFLLGRAATGDFRGGLTASLMAVMMGTFVFTTGSVWKASFGISLMVLVLYALINRAQRGYRILAFALLLLIPFVHHVVSAVLFLLLAFLLAWIWIFALTNRRLDRRIVLDTVTIAVPAAVAGVYYTSVSLDRLSVLSSPIVILLLVAGFVLLSIIELVILSPRPRIKRSLAPLVGVGLAAIVLLDYSGFLFPYSSSASSVVVLLVLSISFLVTVAWYGTECMIEGVSSFRAIQVALLLAPVAVVGVGLVGGLSLFSHQVIYRTFDFFDPFIFIGAGAGLVFLYRRKKSLYIAAGACLIVALAVSFPFAYQSEELLGIRHDTQGFELDAVYWLGESGEELNLVTDERMAYVARNTIGVPIDPSLPQQFATNSPFLHYQWYYLMEESWTSRGVNNYPNGRFVLPSTQYQMTLEASSVFYVGGPSGDHLMMFISSEQGWRTLGDYSG